MDSSAAIGGVILLVGFILFVIIAVVVFKLMSSGWNAITEHDAKRAIEKSVEQRFADANTAQNHARKLLKKYEGK